MRKKILHVLWSGGIGGAEEFVTSLIDYFDEDRYELSVCFLSKKGDIFEEGIISKKNYSLIGMKNGWDVCGALRFYLYLKRNKFDLIHIHSSDILANLVISALSNSKMIFSEHVSPGAKNIFEKRKLFYLFFKNRFNKVIAISEFVKNRLVEDFGVDSSKIEVIHNGIDLNKFAPSNNSILEISTLSEGRAIIGFIGRLEPFKRPESFIRIAESIIKRNKNFCFVMVGDGSEMQKCRKLVVELKLDKQVYFLGFRRDIPGILRHFSGLLFTSEGEGFGMVIIEAMAMGVPIFAIDDGAIPEIIKNKVTGFLLNRNIIPEQISGHLLNIMQDVSLVQRVIQAAKEEVKLNFSIEGCVKKISCIYENELSV